MNNNIKYKTEVFTGIRPTGILTVGNFVGAVKPIIDMQKKGIRPLVFVADLHALTDNEPHVVNDYRLSIVHDYLALGLSTEETDIFIQSSLQDQIYELDHIFLRDTLISELLRVPTLKDKLKSGQNPESANALLAVYPVMMASDILLQGSHYVPVGQDQIPHIEFTRRLAENFNKKYGPVFALPQAQEEESLKIRSLNGEGKMSKSKPEGAIFLTDDPELARKKIQRSITAFAGEMNEGLESNILLAKELTEDIEKQKQIDELVKMHMEGKNVMADFKKVFGDIVVDFLIKFQQNRDRVTSDPNLVSVILERGTNIATKNANELMDDIRKAFWKA